MSIRITQAMLYSRAVLDIQRGLSRYSQLQQEVATGRRINRPSDDPAAALRILPLRGDIADLVLLGNNVALARETLDTGAASLEDASALMQRLRELTTQAANGTLSREDRRGIASEIDQMLGQLVSIANSRHGDRFLFGGTESGRPPFELVDGPGGTRVLYHGNHEMMQIDVAPGVTTPVNLAGDAIFQRRDRGATVFSAPGGALPTGAASAGGDTGVGFGELQVTFAGLHTDAPTTMTAGAGATNALGPLAFAFTSAPPTLSVGGGPALDLPITDGDFTTADGRTISLTVTGVPTTTTGTFTAKAGLSIDGGETVTEVAAFGPGSVMVRGSHDGSVLNVDVENLSRTGTEAIKYEGTFDAFTTLIALRDLLRNDAGHEAGDAGHLIGQLLAEVDGAHGGVLDGLRELGFRSSSVDMLGNRVEGLRVSRQEALSNVQDTDIAAAILELQRQDLSYQAALQVSARVIQTSLVGILR